MYLNIIFCASFRKLNIELQDFVDHSVMQQGGCQRSSSRLQIQAVTREITTIPARKIRNILTLNWLHLPWKRQSASLWMAWRHRNAVASRTCTDFLGACQCLLQRKVKK